MRDDIYTDNDGVRTFNLQKLFGQGYNNGLFFNFKGRYRFFVGSRSSKKSQNICGYEVILKILSDDRRNIVMCRQNDVDNRNSTFNNLVACIEDLGLTDKFQTRTQPLEIEYKATKQRIVFKGLNNPTSITSTKFPHGYLTDIYIEEAYECTNYDDFLKLDGSLRVSGRIARDIQIQITCVMNPWSPDHWIFTEFFKGRLEVDEEYMETHKYEDYKDDNFVGPFGKGLYLHQSNYKINEFRDKETWDPAAKEMKRRSPDLYKPNFLGLFGATTGLAYPEFGATSLMSQTDIFEKFKFVDFAIGIDTGYSNGEGKKQTVKKGENAELKIRSATTMCLVGITQGYDKIVVIDEYFHSNDKSANSINTDNTDDLGQPALLDQLIKYIIDWKNKYGNSNAVKGVLMKGTINCFIDSADVGTRTNLTLKVNQYGLYNVRILGSTKKSIQSRVDFDRLMFAFGDLILSKETTPNLQREYRNARKGEKGEARMPGNDHLLDGCDYAKAPFLQSITRWKTQFKEH